MRIAKLYDKISADYHDFDFYDILARANQIALTNIEAAGIFQRAASADNDSNQGATPSSVQVVDLGVGDGRFLELFHKRYPHAKLTGLDISAKMLAIAQQKTNFQPIHASIEHASTRLPHATFTLATANFVCAYVGIANVLAQAKPILAPGGYVSIITSTFESFSLSQQYMQKMAQSYQPIRRFLGVRAQKALSSALCPANQKEIIDTARHYGFTVKQCEKLVIDVDFETADDFLEKGISSGVLVSLFEQSRLPSKFLQEAVKLLIRSLKLPFPWQDRCVLEVALLQKTDSNQATVL